MADKILTEEQVKVLTGSSETITADKCCTAARAKVLGATTSYANNRLVTSTSIGKLMHDCRIINWGTKSINQYQIRIKNETTGDAITFQGGGGFGNGAYRDHKYDVYILNNGTGSISVDLDLTLLDNSKISSSIIRVTYTSSEPSSYNNTAVPTHYFTSDSSIMYIHINFT